MLKNKPLLIFAAIFFLNLYLGSISFAVEDIELNNKYPDYAYEFTGKDKCEKFNRKLFVFNLKLNRYILRPVNIVWASILPKYGMDRLKNAYNNINFPVRFVGCVLQKDFKASRQEALRFLTNTTLGLGGLYDPAKNRFKIEPRQEDMEQVLAHYKIKQGPYLVLPIVRGNIRDLVGQLLDYPLRPFSYIPLAGGIANAVFSVNNTTYIQPIFKKIDETYADPYEIARQIDGITKYIKNENLDREEVFREKTAAQNIIKISNTLISPCLKPDLELKNYNPQSPMIDSMRTAMFREQNPKKSMWSDLSVWNRNFEKKIKTAEINVDKSRPNYRYRYILQNNRTAPLAIIYPSIGEGITSEHSTVITKILYEEGYSVVIQGSAFQWEFVKSMPEGYRPGLPYEDASHLRIVTSKILNDLESKKGCKFDKKIIVGTSFGALTALFVAGQEENDNTLNISKYISVSPPIELFFALKQVDKYSQNWKNDPSDIKLRAAITAEKTVNTYKKISDEKPGDEVQNLPFTDDEAKLISGFIMKQKLSDVVFAIKNGSRSRKSNLDEKINRMSFYDYSQKYLFDCRNKTPEKFYYDTSLYSLADFLQKSKNYKIYQSIDDYFVNPEQLIWLKKQSGNKSFFLSNGSHLGFLYRKEFLDEFKKDIKLDKDAEVQNDTSKGGL
ncbi:MAG: MlaA family lipoprotein [Candidatus Gastranaerophilaceae bacterium]